MSQLQKTIWVTGASSGLGRSLVLALVAEGHRVIASARNETALKELETLSDLIVALPFDMTRELDIPDVTEALIQKADGLDQVIFNAGGCEYLEFPNPDWSALRRVMELNYFGTLNCLQIALPLLRKNKASPHIVCIASQATAAPFPRAEAYGASKAALQYLFASLRIDLAPENIDVTVVNPGFVDTPLTRQNNFPMPFLMDVDVAARRIVKRIEDRPRVYSFPFRLTLLLAVSKLLPSLWQKMMSSQQHKSTTDNGI
jgi:short-subunit dehydrogenase